MKTELKNEIKALINDRNLAEPDHPHSFLSEKTLREMLLKGGVLPSKIDEAVEKLSKIPYCDNVEPYYMPHEEVLAEIDRLLKRIGWK